MPYSPVAEKLRVELKEGDAWTAYPYFVANCLYRYGPLPEPFLPYSGFSEYQEFINARSSEHGLFIVTLPKYEDSHPAFNLAVRRFDFDNGHLILLKLPPAKENSTDPSDSEKDSG